MLLEMGRRQGARVGIYKEDRQRQGWRVEGGGGRRWRRKGRRKRTMGLIANSVSKKIGNGREEAEDVFKGSGRSGIGKGWRQLEGWE